MYSFLLCILLDQMQNNSFVGSKVNDSLEKDVKSTASAQGSVAKMYIHTYA